MTNEKVEITITDDNHRVFDINEIPVSIDAVIEHLAYVGRWVGAVPNSEFNLEEHLKTNDYPLVGWSSADTYVLVKLYIDARGVETIEYNINEPQDMQRFVIVYGMLMHEAHLIKKNTAYWLTKQLNFDSYGNFVSVEKLFKRTAASLLMPANKVKEFLESLNITNDTGISLIRKAVSKHFNAPVEAVQLLVDKTKEGIVIRSFLSPYKLVDHIPR